MRLLLHVYPSLESWVMKEEPVLKLSSSTPPVQAVLGIQDCLSGLPLDLLFAAHHDVPAVARGHGLVGRHCTVLVYLEPLFLMIRDPSAYGYRKELFTHFQPSENKLLRNALTDKGRICVRAEGDLDINPFSLPQVG